MKTQDDILRIEDYLDGKLTQQENSEIKERLVTDSEFAKLYAFRLKLRDDLQKAKHYENTRKQVSSAIKREQNQSRRLVIYAIAAGLALLVAIPGIYTMVNRTETTVAETDSTSTEVYEPQTSQPNEVASDGQYIPELSKMKVTQTNDSVIFEWEPSLEKPSKLVILSLLDFDEALSIAVESHTQRMALPSENLPAAKLVWYIEGFAGKDTIEIYKAK